MTGRESAQEGDDDDPAGRCQKDRFSILGSPSNVEVEAGKERTREYAVHDMKEVVGSVPEKDLAHPGGTLQERQAGHQKIGGAKPPAHGSVAKVFETAPKPEDDGEDHKSEREPNVKKPYDAAHGVSLSVCLSAEAEEPAERDDYQSGRAGHPSGRGGERLQLSSATEALNPLDPLVTAHRWNRTHGLKLHHFRPPILVTQRRLK